MKLYDDLSGNGQGVGFVRQAVAEGRLTGAGRSDAVQLTGGANAVLSGTFQASLRLEKSLDNKVTWQPVTAFGVGQTFTAPCSESFAEPEDGAWYSWNCTSFTSGEITYRISK